MKQFRIIVLFSIIFIAVAGYGMIVPILPFYAEKLGASPTDLGFLFAVYPLGQFIFSPIWGQLSDRIGRRPVILAGMMGFALSFALLGVANTLFALFVARILGGILSSATLPTAYAFIADVTQGRERSQGISWLSASTGLGIFLGPAIGGYLGDIRPDLPFYGAAVLSLLFAIAGFVLLPESLAHEKRRNVAPSPWNLIIAPLLSGFQYLKGPLGFMLLLSFFMNFASANLESTLGLMVADSLGAGAREVGLVFTVAGVVMVIVQGLFVGPLINRFGEAPLIQVGLLASAVGYWLLPQAPSVGTLLLIMGIMSVFSSAMRPAQATMLSKAASAEEQGIILGQNNSFMSIGRVFGPITGGFLYNISYFTPFTFAALIFLGTMIFGAFRFGAFARSRNR